MEYTKLGPVEGRFADLIWENAPVPTAQLVALAGDALDWKRTTTYTVLKRLCDRGLFLLENGTVTAQISRAEFSRSRKLRPEEVEALQKLIDESRR